ncbi:hypothetical protein PPACK8108_LOCUS16871 [Phakopsora pachyrhizi]|nr:hypothetical protein PPACK8108_LOCUS16871 [Phakopsora pachyrhizi]
MTYCLSTQSYLKNETKPDSRMLVHRGFVNERRKIDDTSSNSKEIGSGVALVACTDIRSSKVDQIVDRNSASDQEGRMSSICWWLEPKGEQFRICAQTYIIPPKSRESTFPKLSKHDSKRLGPLDDTDHAEEKNQFDWEDERLRIFEKLSPELKASFLRPSPGSVLRDDPKDWPSRLDDQLLYDRALDNFALLIFDPVYVDLVKLKVQPHQRITWTKNSDEEWVEQKLVP